MLEVYGLSSSGSGAEVLSLLHVHFDFLTGSENVHMGKAIPEESVYITE